MLIKLYIFVILLHFILTQDFNQAWNAIKDSQQFKDGVTKIGEAWSATRDKDGTEHINDGTQQQQIDQIKQVWDQMTNNNNNSTFKVEQLKKMWDQFFSGDSKFKKQDVEALWQQLNKEEQFIKQIDNIKVEDLIVTINQLKNSLHSHTINNNTIRIDNLLLDNINSIGLYAAVTKCKNNDLNSWQCRYCTLLGAGNRLIKIIENAVMQTRSTMIVNDNKRQIVISFRGTETQFNLIQDFNILLTDLKYYNKNQFNNLLVHKGFFDLSESVLFDIANELKVLLANVQTKDYNIVFTGHSLGGALAALTAIKLRNIINLPSNKIHIYTFGQPRIGNLEYVKYVNSLNLNYYRMVNFNDPVPHAPPRILGYFHHGIEIFQNQDSSITQCQLNESMLEDFNCSLSVTPDFDRKLHSRFDKLDFSWQC